MNLPLTIGIAGSILGLLLLGLVWAILFVGKNGETPEDVLNELPDAPLSPRFRTVDCARAGVIEVNESGAKHRQGR